MSAEYFDWTVNEKTGHCNSSDLMNALEEHIAGIIKGDAHALLNGRAIDTAGLILAHLAHKFKFIPSEETPTPSEIRSGR